MVGWRGIRALLVASCGFSIADFRFAIERKFGSGVPLRPIARHDIYRETGFGGYDMAMRVTVNGREVTNPAARALAAMMLMAIVAFVMSLLLFVALPLLGVVVGTALGLLGVGAGSLLIGVPL